MTGIQKERFTKAAWMTERERGAIFFFATCNFENLSFSIQLFSDSFASFKRNYKYILKILSLCCHILDKT